MRKRTAQLLSAKDLFDQTHTVMREGYSGRGMFGKETFAVEYKDTQDLALAAALAMKLVESPDDEAAFLDDLGELRFDQMGYGMIAY